MEKRFTIYVCNEERRGCSENFAFSWSLEEAAKDALAHFEGLTKREKDQCDIWVSAYVVEENLCDFKDAEKTFNDMVDKDFDDGDCIRNAVETHKLNRINSTVYNSNITISDDFGNCFDFSTCRDDMPDDEYDAIDSLYDSIGWSLIADKDYIKDCSTLAYLDGIIESKF